MAMETKEEMGAESRMTRRRVLALMGVTGAALAETKVGALAQQAPVAAVNEASRIFATVEAMRNATSLQPGMLAQTLGYHAPSDGGGAYYLVVKPATEEKANDGDVIALQAGLVAQLQEARAVNYRMFGAVGDGKNDDGVQMKLAHEYANRHGLPVVNPAGEFWIKQANNIPIATDVHWGQSIFHIDEQYNSKTIPRFAVLNDGERKSLELDAKTKAAILAKLKPGVQVIPELAPYKNCLVQVLDANDKVGFRAGEKFKGQAWAREELFYVEEHGRIIGDIAWQFKDYTQLNVTPCNDHYLVIEGGGFYLSGDNPGTKYTGYYNCGFQVARSRTIIRNQWMGLEKGKADISMEPRRGFYGLNHVYDVTLENIRLIPWEQNRDDPAKKVGAGTYGIAGGRMLNCTFRNVTAEGSWVHWGVFGTNVNKNFRIENCQLNRVDVHFHCWNLYIRDSTIGFRGISVTGGGHLWIENTVRHGNQFINFRADFGSVWDGDIHMSNCRLVPSSDSECAILRNVMSNANYGYPIGAARSVTIEDFIVDYSAAPESKEPCWLMQIVPFSKTKGGERLFFPHDLVFRNIQVTGREQGVRLLQIPQPGGYDLGRVGHYDGVLLEPNARMTFESVQLEKIAPAPPDSPEQVHLRIGGSDAQAAIDGKALYPQIRFIDCANLAVFLGNVAAGAHFERCSIDRLTAAPGSPGQPFKGRLAFSDCRFLPQITLASPDTKKPVYNLNTELGTSFTNCTLNAPRVNGQARPELFDRFDFVQLNKIVRYYHTNTVLGNDILTSCKKRGIKLSPAFVSMLKGHHALESEKVGK